MQVRLHKNATTTPKTRALIQASSEPNTLTGSALRGGRGYYRALETPRLDGGSFSPPPSPVNHAQPGAREHRRRSASDSRFVLRRPSGCHPRSSSLPRSPALPCTACSSATVSRSERPSTSINLRSSPSRPICQALSMST